MLQKSCEVHERLENQASGSLGLNVGLDPAWNLSKSGLRCIRMTGGGIGNDLGSPRGDRMASQEIAQKECQAKAKHIKPKQAKSTNGFEGSEPTA